MGKIGLPDAILDKPGRLTEGEYTMVKGHSGRGAEIVMRISGFSTVAQLVRWHHERLDGSGYPDGLQGEQIPLLARILAVADTMDAMVSARPYRAGMPLAAALAELRRCAGLPFDEGLAPGRDHRPRRHFDPQVVQALIEALDGGLEIETGSLPAVLPLPEARVVSQPRNCWEIRGCGLETLSPTDGGLVRCPSRLGSTASIGAPTADARAGRSPARSAGRGIARLRRAAPTSARSAPCSGRCGRRRACCGSSSRRPARAPEGPRPPASHQPCRAPMWPALSGRRARGVGALARSG